MLASAFSSAQKENIKPHGKHIERRKAMFREMAGDRSVVYVRWLLTTSVSRERYQKIRPDLIYTDKKGVLTSKVLQFEVYADFSAQRINTKGEPIGGRILDFYYYSDRQLPPGYGVYWVPNIGSGFLNSQIHTYPCLFYEIDNISIEAQWDCLYALEGKLGFKASRVVQTKKSLHVYFFLTEPASEGDWKKYIERLIDYMQSDKAVKNPSRLMRVPGFFHTSWDGDKFETKGVKIAQKCDKLIPLSAFDFLPASKKERQAIERNEKIAQALERRAQEGNFNALTSWDDNGSSIEKVQEAVNYLPVRIVGGNTYTLCRDALWGLCDAVGIDMAIRLYEQHSPSGEGWDISAIANKFVPGQITSGTFWYYAKAGGYRPARETKQTVTAVRATIKKAQETVAAVEQIEVPDSTPHVWEMAKAKGKRFVIDRRLPGAGKTHMVETITDNYVYVTPNPYNPATEFLYAVPKYPARYDERWDHPTKLNANGDPLSESKENGGVRVAGNCINAMESNLASSAGIELKVCTGCPVKEKCLSGEAVMAGGESGYLYQKAKSRTLPQVRMHPQSLPRLKEMGDEEWYQDRIVIFDDVSVTASVQKKVGRSHLLQLAERVRSAGIRSTLTAFFDRLVELSDIAALPGYRFGLSAFDCKPQKTLREILEDGEDLKLMELEAEQFELLYPGRDESASAGLKKAEVKSIEWAINENRKEAIKQLYEDGGIGSVVNPLVYQLDSIYGFDAEGNMIISWRNRVIADAISLAKMVWISDATASLEDIMQRFDLKPEEVLLIGSSPRDNSNLEIVEATGLGPLTRFSTAESIRDVIAIVCGRAKDLGAGKVGLIISTDILTQDQVWQLENAGVIYGKPHSDSRGSNAFQSVKEIYAGTSFRQNKESLANEYTLIYGELVSPTDILNPKWLAFCARKQVAELIQFVGRVRHTRRQTETVRVILLGHLSDLVLGLLGDAMPGIEVYHEFAVDLDGYTLRDAETTKIKIMQAMIACHTDGREKLTWPLLASISALKESTIRSVFTNDIAFRGKTPSQNREEVFAQIERGETYLNSQLLRMVSPETFDKRNGVEEPPPPTDSQIESIIEAREAYLDVVEDNVELAAEILPVVDEDFWEEDLFRCPLYDGPGITHEEEDPPEYD